MFQCSSCKSVVYNDGHLLLGAVWKLHVHPVRCVASRQSVCLRRLNDDLYQRINATQFPAGASSHPAGGETGASAEQCPHSVQVSVALQGIYTIISAL